MGFDSPVPALHFHSLSFSLLAISVFCQCCVMPLLSTGRQVLLYSCCIVLLLDRCVNVCGERRGSMRARERERICFWLCMCVHVCVSVLQFSVAMATPGTWLSQLCAAQHCQSRAAGGLSLGIGELHTHTPSLCDSETFRLTDGQSVSNTNQCTLFSPLSDRDGIAMFCCILCLNVDRKTQFFKLGQSESNNGNQSLKGHFSIIK